MAKFTYGDHPEAKRKASIFKYAVFLNGELYEGFRTLTAAEGACNEYRTAVEAGDSW
jgi:hypothetical protein